MTVTLGNGLTKMYKLEVFTSDEKWVQLFADWKLGEVMIFMVHWFRDRENKGDYCLDTFRILDIGPYSQAYIHVKLGVDEVD